MAFRPGSSNYQRDYSSDDKKGSDKKKGSSKDRHEEMAKREKDPSFYGKETNLKKGDNRGNMGAKGKGKGGKRGC